MPAVSFNVKLFTNLVPTAERSLDINRGLNFAKTSSMSKTSWMQELFFDWIEFFTANFQSEV